LIINSAIVKRNRHNVYKIVGSPVLELLKMRNARMYVVNLMMIFYGSAGGFMNEPRTGQLVNPKP
jgi:hypothetical protein